jgi:hypothetical protein
MEGEELVSFYTDLQEAVPAERDPYLQNLDPILFGYVDAGLLVHTGRVYRAAGKTDEAEAVGEELQALLEEIITRMAAKPDTVR